MQVVESVFTQLKTVNWHLVMKPFVMKHILNCIFENFKALMLAIQFETRSNYFSQIEVWQQKKQKKKGNGENRKDMTPI